MFRTAATVLAVFFTLGASACAPKVGTPEWCGKMQERPKGDWTANEAGDFLKHCVVPGTEAPK
jgi:DUF3012 family protein